MIRESKSQGNEEEGNYLNELLERAKSRHGCNSWEEFAALITMRSGDQVSGQTFRRNLRKGVSASKELSLSLLQWAAIAEVTGVSITELVRRFKTQGNDNNLIDGG
jgi:AraC-like DNA-binding protein